MATSSDRFFPVTILGDRLHVRGIPHWLPWESSRLDFWPESDLDRILPATGDPKARTAEELQAVMNERYSHLAQVDVGRKFRRAPPLDNLRAGR